MSVASRFNTLITRIKPLQSEVDKATSHAYTIKSRLKKDFNLVKFIRIGSHSRMTAIRHFSDVDFLAVLSKKHVEWGDTWVNSTTFLGRFRNSLSQRYTDTTIRRDKQAIVIEFGKGEYAVDIVPGIYLGPGPNNYPVYAIPDGKGWWMNTSPELHGKYIKKANWKSMSKLSRSTQLLKFWKCCRVQPIPIMSFHLEILLASADICVGAKSYAYCLMEAFKLLNDRECRSLQDPHRISGYIQAATTDSQRDSAYNAVNCAYEHAVSALYAELNRNVQEAYSQWDIIFNGQFPKR